MKILVYGLNYSPEITGAGKYTGEMAAWLARRGHEVRVVTAPPYYPAWRVDSAYRGRSYCVESSPGTLAPRVYRCPLWVPAKPRGGSRIVHLMSFALSSAPVMALQTLWKPDIVFTIEPTFFGAPVALLSATFAGAASWLHVQDFEVDAAFRLELLPKDGRIHWLAKGFERFFTGCFTRVSTISAKMVERIVAKGAVRGEVLLFPNWGDTEAVKPAEPGSENPFRKLLNLQDKIVFLYSGNLGVKQGLEILDPLSASFEDDPRVHFLICGDGAFRAPLKALIGKRKNVTMLPLQPVERLNDLLNAADIHLLPQRRGVADLVMPSKLYGILASGRPVIATTDLNTQVASIVEGCGLVVPAEDPASLRSAAVRLVEDYDLRTSLGMAAREYAVKYLGKEPVLCRFEQDMVALVKPPERTEDVQLAQSYRG